MCVYVCVCVGYIDIRLDRLGLAFGLGPIGLGLALCSHSRAVGAFVSCGTHTHT